MSRIEAKCKLCRRENTKLYLKGVKCTTAKCPQERRPFAPGQHGKVRIRESEYRRRLREKQKAQRFYGLSEGQFRNYFIRAKKDALKFLQLLERRLDNVIFRMGLALSRVQARQLVLHGHIKVNNRKVNIPSFSVKIGDVINIRDKSQEKIKANLELLPDHKVPTWLDFNIGSLQGKMVAAPGRDEIDVPVEEHLIVEFYSR